MIIIIDKVNIKIDIVRGEKQYIKDKMKLKKLSDGRIVT